MDNSSIRRTNSGFTEIYERNMDMVYRLCFILLKNTTDAANRYWKEIGLKEYEDAYCHSGGTL